jgi:hypothetical protein
LILFHYYRYGLIWISTTLVFVLALLGNFATYLMEKHTDNRTSWSFDVGYVIVVPLAYYFFLQYMGSNANLIRFWCLWGYSLTIFILSSVSFRFLCMACCFITICCKLLYITLPFAQAHIGLLVSIYLCIAFHVFI